MSGRLGRPLALFVALVVAGGAGVLVAAAFQWDSEDALLLGALAGLTVISEALDFAPFANSRISLSAALIMVAGTLSGLPGVAVIATVAALADLLVHPKPLVKAVFNEGTLLLAGAAYVGVFEAFSTGHGREDWPDVLAPALVGSAANFAVNSALVAFAVALETGDRAHTVWSQKFRWLLPHYVIVGVLAVMTAAAYEEWELGGVALLLVPLAMVWFSIRQYVGMASAFRRRFQRA